MPEFSAKMEARSETSEDVELRLKHSFSKQHFRTSRYFAERSQEIEDKYEHETADEIVKSNHRAYVSGAIISAVAGLESSINELYLEACDKNVNTLQGLDYADLARIAELWDELKMVSLLLKYQMVLMITNHDRFDRGAQPYQNVDSLVKLRNALVHYKPEWDTELQVHENLRSRLESNFAPNPFESSASLWFPHHCLGSGCALWSIKTSQTFLSEFCEKMSIPNRFPTSD